MDLTEAADVGLAQLTFGQIALNESNPVPTNKSPVTPRKRTGSPKLSEDEGSEAASSRVAEAKRRTPKKSKTATPGGPAGAAVARHHKVDGGKATGASTAIAGASAAVVTPE